MPPPPSLPSVLLSTDKVDLDNVISTLIQQKTLQGDDSSFHLCNLDAVVKRHVLWTEELPHIRPYYAVKCNPDPWLVSLLARLGTGFDCASPKEIQQALSVTPASDILFANPVKALSAIRFAASAGVMRMTVDDESELDKLVAEAPNAEIVLRISCGDPQAKANLSKKFGACAKESAPRILQKAHQMGLNVVGVSFHIGSPFKEMKYFEEAFSQALSVCSLGHELGFSMQFLDIGGGFPASDDDYFRKIAASIRSLTAPLSHMTIVAEPGQFFAGRYQTLLNSVIGVRQVAASQITGKAEDAGRIGYSVMVGDGAFGSFNLVHSYTDYDTMKGRPIKDKKEGEDVFPTKIWGPSCDPADMIEPLRMLPRLYPGDWLRYDDAGAYTSAISASFNGHTCATSIHVASQKTMSYFTADQCEAIN